MPLMFLTGIPRSGSTWAAAVLARATSARVIHEPFNWRHWPQHAPLHLQYALAPDSPSVAAALASVQASIADCESDYVIKDVHACFLGPVLERTFPTVVLVLVRHPCAVASSWRRLGYEVGFRLERLIEQQQLVSDHLAPYLDHIRACRGVMMQLGAFWGAVYLVLARLSRSQDWIWISHECLCAEPILALQSAIGIVPRLEPRAIQDAVKSFSTERGEGDYSVWHQTSAQPVKWRADLSPSEAQAVLCGAEPFWSDPHLTAAVSRSSAGHMRIAVD